jgi:hypothetical protein
MFAGVCLGVYIFGDLRQLRKFELSRPSISKPQPIRQRPVISSPISGHRITPIAPPSQPPPSHPSPVSPRPSERHALSHSTSTSSAPTPLSTVQTTASRPPSQLSTISSSGSYDSQPESVSDESCYVSPAFYDPNPVEGPATGACPFQSEQFQPKSAFDHDEDNIFATAAFIHQYEEYDDDEDEGEYPPNKVLTEERQRIDSFDFNALPPRIGPSFKSNTPRTEAKSFLPTSNSVTLPGRPMSSNTSLPVMTPSVMVIQPEAEPVEKSLTPTSFIRRMQSRCNINKWLVMTSSTSSTTDLRSASGTSEKNDSEYASNFPRPHPSLSPKQFDMRKQFKMVKAVPAFASPLTRIHSPVVVRGQWEIVVRSMAIAFILSWVVIGSLLAVPVLRR